MFAAPTKLHSSSDTSPDSNAKALQLHGEKAFESRRTHGKKIHPQRCTESNGNNSCEQKRPTMTIQVDKAEARALLRDRFGHSDFRRGQWAPIKALLDGRDAL